MDEPTRPVFPSLLKTGMSKALKHFAEGARGALIGVKVRGIKVPLPGDASLIEEDFTHLDNFQWDSVDVEDRESAHMSWERANVLLQSATQMNQGLSARMHHKVSDSFLQMTAEVRCSLLRLPLFLSPPPAFFHLPTH